MLQLVATWIPAAAALSVIMMAAWVIQGWTGNSGWVDTIWVAGVGIVGVVLASWPLDAVPWRQVLVASGAALWCLRLGLHIGRRTSGAGDDPRYRALMEEWGEHARRRMFLFLQSQAAVGVVLVVSIGLAARNPAPSLRALDVVGVLILMSALVGEAIADRQLDGFKSDPRNKDGICDIGLWAWSRHPNYFFEWLAWLAFPVVAMDVSLVGRPGIEVAAWLAPLVMYWALVHASGIPPLEAHMLRTRGNLYREYQRRTSAFFPRPPHSASNR